MHMLSLTTLLLFSLGASASPAMSQPLPEAPVQLAAASAPRYGLPLKVYAYAECDKSSTVLYEVTATGQLRYPDGNNPNKYKTRSLARLEIQQLSETLKKADLYTQNQKMKRIPAGTPQTEECRSIEKIELEVNGVKKTIDAKRSRTIYVTPDYILRIEQLYKKLKELSQR